MKHYDNKKKGGIFHPASGRHFESNEALQKYLDEKKDAATPKIKPTTEDKKKKTDTTEDK